MLAVKPITTESPLVSELPKTLTEYRLFGLSAFLLGNAVGATIAVAIVAII